MGIPRFVADNYLDLAVIEKIWRFRSSVSHDYHDQFEGCRSMKHYFFPRSAADWSTIPIYAPVSGAVELTRSDLFGVQVVIRSSAQPAFTFVIFHLNPSISLS